MGNGVGRVKNACGRILFSSCREMRVLLEMPVGVGEVDELKRHKEVELTNFDKNFL